VGVQQAANAVGQVGGVGLGDGVHVDVDEGTVEPESVVVSARQSLYLHGRQLVEQVVVQLIPDHHATAELRLEPLDEKEFDVDRSDVGHH
jgi:hypothetical protein